MDIFFIAPAWVKILYLLSHFIVLRIEGYVVQDTFVCIY